MAVSMKQVRAFLDPEEPDYDAAAQLGPDAIPHLQTLVHGSDPMLASKAVYLASLIESVRSVEVLRDAAQHSDPIVRVAAAAATRNLSATEASDVLARLITDRDPGVRKVVRTAVPEEVPEDLARRLREMGEEVNVESEQAQRALPVVDQRMPGESSTQSHMPGERTGQMPGESQGRMPGERG